MVAGVDKVKKNIHDWIERQKAASLALAQNWAGQLEGRAKTNAPWTDRTSHARGGLFGSVELKEDALTIHLSQTMEYGVFLELANDGRFAILKPTINAALEEIQNSYRVLWE